MLSLSKSKLLSKKLHILFLSSWYPSRVFPTNGDFVQRHAEAVSIDNQVTVIHLVTDMNIKKQTEIVDQTINNVRTIIAYVPSTIFPKFFIFLKIYLKLIKRIGHFDLVHLNVTYPKGLIVLYLKWFQKKNYIITEHWTGYLYPLNKSIGLGRKLLTKLIVKNAYAVCPVSNNLAKNMKDFGLKGTYMPIPNVVNTELFTPKVKSGETFKILHVSNMLDSQKNVSGILHTLGKLIKQKLDFEVILVGENSSKFKELAAQVDLTKIKFIDHITQKELIHYFHEASLFLLNSNHENLPCVILESFSTGTPVISTNVGGISEYFPKGFGSLIPVNNEEALLKKIQDYYLKKEKVATIEEMNSYAKNNFSRTMISKKFTDLYQELLTTK